MIPVRGEPLDGINGVIYFMRQDYLGSAGDGRAWHNIIEQFQIKTTRAGFTSIDVNNIDNIINMPTGSGTVHNAISSFYSSKDLSLTNGIDMTIRDWLSTYKSFDEQFKFGIKELKKYGDVIPTSNGWEFVPFYLGRIIQEVIEKQETEGIQSVIKKDHIPSYQRYLAKQMNIEYIPEDRQVSKENKTSSQETLECKNTTNSNKKESIKMSLSEYKGEKQIIKNWKESMEEYDANFTTEDVNECENALNLLIDSLMSYGEKITNEEIMQYVKEVVIRLNEIDEKTGNSLIETTEREVLWKFITAVAESAGLVTDKKDITEEWREW